MNTQTIEVRYIYAESIGLGSIFSLFITLVGYSLVVPTRVI